MTSVFVVEDHPVMRATLRGLLETQPGLRVVGMVASATEALAQVPLARPDLVLVDLSLPDMSGDLLVTRLLAQQPDLRTLIVSGHEAELYAATALRAGARGFVMKDDPEALVRAIRELEEEDARAEEADGAPERATRDRPSRD